MDPAGIITIILGVFAAASILGTAAAVFYGVRQKTIITTLQESNNAYKERNTQLEAQLIVLEAELKVIKAKVEALELIKTPPLEPLTKIVVANHKEVMKTLRGKGTS